MGHNQLRFFEDTRRYASRPFLDKLGMFCRSRTLYWFFDILLLGRLNVVFLYSHKDCFRKLVISVLCHIFFSNNMFYNSL